MMLRSKVVEIVLENKIVKYVLFLKINLSLRIESAFMLPTCNVLDMSILPIGPRATAASTLIKLILFLSTDSLIGSASDIPLTICSLEYISR